MKKIVFILVILFILSYSYLHLMLTKKGKIARPQNPQNPIALINNLVQSFNGEKESGLGKAVETALTETHGRYAVAIKNLKTGQSYYLNEHAQFEAGSLYKVWVMAEAFNQIEAGELKKNETLTKQISELNEKFEIDPELAEETEGEISLSVSEALTQMITISHNYAALLLSEKVRLSRVDEFLKKNSLNESLIGQPPQTTAADMALFFEKLYKGELAGKNATMEMIDLLKKQKLNEKLPKYLPEEVNVAHKTGEIVMFSHDAGIVYGERGDYVIVVLSESDYPTEAIERIADVSKAVFDYFEGK